MTAPVTTPTAPPSSARRLIVTLLVPVLYLVLLFQLVVVVPRYAKVFAQYGLKLPDLTQFCVDASAWVVAQPVFALSATAVVVIASMVVVNRAYRSAQRRRGWVLFLVYAVPLLAFLVVWLGVAGPHAKLMDGLQR